MIPPDPHPNPDAAFVAELAAASAADEADEARYEQLARDYDEDDQASAPEKSASNTGV